jgi:hypothetical protein
VQYTDSATAKFNAIQFTDLDHGWVVGDSAKILKTTDGGANWTLLTNTGLASNFRSKGLFFLNTNIGWIGSKFQNMPVTADVGVNLYTNNGGATWTTQSFPGANISDNVWSIFFWDAGNGWCTSDDGLIGHTTSGGSTAVSEGKIMRPTSFSLEQNYPNPFNPATNIAFTLPAKSFVSLKIFDVIGREIATVVSEELSSGPHAYTWNAGALGSGVYFYRLQAGSFIETKKLILIK